MSSFTKLLRNSNFVKAGIFQNPVRAKIVHRVNEDLYIDFGGKFYAVCQRPEKDRERYVIGQDVIIRLRDFELSERFLGSNHDLTLLEADAILIGLIGRRKQQQS